MDRRASSLDFFPFFTTMTYSDTLTQIVSNKLERQSEFSLLKEEWKVVETFLVPTFTAITNFKSGFLTNDGAVCEETGDIIQLNETACQCIDFNDTHEFVRVRVQKRDSKDCTVEVQYEMNAFFKALESVEIDQLPM